MKKCAHCKLEKPLSEFGARKRNSDGLQTHCKLCHTAKSLAVKSRLVLDPITGETITAGALANRQWRRSGARADYFERNPIAQLRNTMAGVLKKKFKNQGWGKQTKTQKLLGCSFEEFKTHIERQFLPGMTWENHGAWHYDHVIPCNCAENILELEALQHWSNFRPLWGSDNLSKGHTPPDNWKERLAELLALLDK